jgi:ATP-dependent DNA ligase
MKTFIKAIRAAEQISTKKEKHAVLMGLTPVGQRLVRESFDPDRTFGVKSWEDPIPAKTDGDINMFFSLLDRLADRTLTGNAAKDAVSYVLSRFTADTAELLTRVIKQDLKCGASDSTFNKLYPGLIPEYPIMLAKAMHDNFEWKFPVIAEIKYDGQRITAFVSAAGVKMVSRGGRNSTDEWHGAFDEDLQKLRAASKFDAIVVDGEVLGKESVDGTVQVKKGSKADKDSNLFYAFDILDMRDWGAHNGHTWSKMQCRWKQSQRSLFLEELIKKAGLTTVIKSEYKWCNNKMEAEDFYNRALDLKHEGLILKDPNAVYVWDRDEAWTKWKPVITVDLKIVGFYEGEGRLAGKLGGVIAEGQDENGRKIQTRVGGGWKDGERDKIWKNKPQYLDKTIEVAGKCLSLSGNRKDVYAVREPVFKRFRTDK